MKSCKILYFKLPNTLQSFTWLFCIFIFTLSIYLFPLEANAGFIVRTPVYVGLSEGLVGYWTLDGKDTDTNGTVDISGNANHGTLKNTPKPVLGRLGQALEFNGVNNFINIPDADILDIDSNHITSSAWVYPYSCTGAGDGFQTIITKQVAYYFNLNTACKPQFYWYSLVSPGYHTSADAVPTNQWSHVVSSYNGDTDTLKIYINGEVTKVVTGITGDGAENSNPLVIGGYSAATRSSDGIVDDVRLYNRALSADEIKRLYKTGATTKFGVSNSVGTLKEGLEAHWTFDGKDTFSASTADVSGNANHGTLVNGPKIAIGKLGQALEFDGVNDYINAGTIPNMDFRNSYSISLWVKLDIFGDPDSNCGDDRATLFMKQNANWGVDIRTGPASNSIQFVCYDSSNVVGHSMSKQSLSPNVWHHVVGIHDSVDESSYLYVNGELVGTDTAAVCTKDVSANNLYIGAIDVNCTDDFTDGTIDDLRIYSRNISADEVKRLYKLGATTKFGVSNSAGSLSDGLIGHWTFDGRDTNTVGTVDVSNNDNHGALKNSPVPVLGKLGQAMKFNGTDEYVVSTAMPAITDAFSFVVWVKADPSQGSSPTILAYQDTSWGLLLERGVDGTIHVYNNDDWQWLNSSGFDYDYGNWQHIAVTWSQDTGLETFYENGVQANQYAGETTAVSSVSDASELKIAVRAGSSKSGALGTYFNGFVDDVRIYNRALSAEEIKRLYNMGR
jgi:hypothetical protein